MLDSPAGTDVLDLAEEFSDGHWVNQATEDKRVDELDVLFPAGDQLRSGQIVRVQAPASRSRTRIDLWDQPVKPTLLQHRRVDRDPVDVKAEGLLEAGVLPKGTVKVVR
ncbi:MAG TPA: hypothetical protein PKD89_17155 [Candidatus Microthrix sp.]|nr:hypothetical protein [Candidatus Microthrix sp.]